jgi:hypothetical protein
MRRLALGLALAGSALSAGGCGLGIVDNPSGGDDNLPTQAAGPYGKPEVDFDTPADEPYVLAEAGAQLRDPDALPRDDGGVRLWFSRQAETLEIWYAELADTRELPDVAPARALAADADWEQGQVTAPSVVDLGDGHLVMFYEGGDTAPAIGRADSTDDGTTWQKHAANPVLAGARRPGAALVDGAWLLYAVRDDEDGIWRASSSDDGASFTLDAGPALRPRPLLAEAFDGERVDDPEVVVTVNDAGRAHLGLFFTGAARDGADLVESIGYAGSFDGVAFERFGGAEAVLDQGSPGETAPTVIVRTTQGVMFYGEVKQGTSRIGVALHP